MELKAAAQGIDFRAPHKTSSILQKVHHKIRERVPHYTVDRFFAPDMEQATQMVIEGDFSDHIMDILPSGSL